MEQETKLKRIGCGIYFGIVACFVALRTLSAFGVFSSLNSNFSYLFTIIGQIILLLGGSVFLFAKISKNKIKNTLTFYGYRKISKKTVLNSFLIGIVVFFLTIFISSFFNTILALLGFDFGTSSAMTSYPFSLLIINLIFTGVLPAVCEETAHRGMLLNTKIGKNGKITIILSGLMFGLLHMNIEQFFYATLIGLYLGFLTDGTKTIYPAMIIHFTNNALSVLLNYSSVKGTLFASLFIKFENIFYNNVILGIILSISVFVLLLYLLSNLTKKLLITNATSQVFINKEAFEKFIQREMFFADLKNDNNITVNGNKMIIKSDDFMKDLFNIKEIKYKRDKIAEVFIWLSIILSGAVTIFTLVWGFL